jgi:hypothetical protein
MGKTLHNDLKACDLSQAWSRHTDMALALDKLVSLDFFD